jgi:serine/threonine-protein kinase RsbW
MPMPATSTAAPRTSTRTYPGTADQARNVRADLRPLLVGCPVADDLLLCASELAANAALHSRSARAGGTITVRAELRPGEQMRIEVRDDGGLWPEHLRCPQAGAERPHGLDILTALVSDWGIITTRTTRPVWAKITWPNS